MRRSGQLLIAAAAVAIVVGCEKGSKVIARVGDSVITVKDFKTQYKLIHSQRPATTASPSFREALLNSMVRKKVIVWLARKAGFDQSEEYKAFLQRTGAPPRRMRWPEPICRKCIRESPNRPAPRLRPTTMNIPLNSAGNP